MSAPAAKYRATDLIECKDCGQDHYLVTMTLMVNRSTKAQHFVCAECVKNYNLRRPT